MDNTMNPEIKAQWLTALRSGDYRQGQGSLKRDGKFCCLGVLCDLAVKAGIAAETHVTMIGATAFGTGPADENSGTLPFVVQTWAGLPSNNPSFRYNVLSADEYEYDSLAGLNDGGRSFAEIADLIEEHF